MSRVQAPSATPFFSLIILYSFFLVRRTTPEYVLALPALELKLVVYTVVWALQGEVAVLSASLSTILPVGQKLNKLSLVGKPAHSGEVDQGEGGCPIRRLHT